MVGANKLPPAGDPTAVGAVGAGMKGSMIVSGWQFEPDQQVTIGGRSFALLLGHNSSLNASTIAYLTGAGHEVYTIIFLGKKAITPGDHEISAALQSFRLLSFAPPMPVTSFSPLTAFQSAFHFGFLMGRIAGIALLIALLALIWRMFRWMFSRDNH